MRRAIASFALLWGCAAPQLPGAGGANAAGAAKQQDGLDLQLSALDVGLRDDGLSRRGLLERGFLPPGGRAAFPIQIAAGECAVFMALASASMADLDASLYTADGTALVEDDSVSSRPALTFCAASEAISGYLTLHAYQGAGSFVAAQFARAARPDDDLRMLGDPARASELGQLAQALHERGFEDAAPRVDLPLGEARPVRMALNVAAGECYTLAAEGSEGLAEVAIRLVDPQGGELANGVGEPRLAALQYCANERAELALEVVARRGQGMAHVARFRAAQGLVGGARALWLGEPSPTASAWSEAKGKGLRPSERRPPFSRKLSLGQGQLAEVETPGASCERLEARLEPGLARVTMRIESLRGELLGEVESQHMRACALICSQGPRRVTLVGRSGFGTVLLSATPQPSSAAAPACGPCGEGEPVRCSSSSGRR